MNAIKTKTTATHIITTYENISNKSKSLKTKKVVIKRLRRSALSTMTQAKKDAYPEKAKKREFRTKLLTMLYGPMIDNKEQLRDEKMVHSGLLKVEVRKAKKLLELCQYDEETKVRHLNRIIFLEEVNEQVKANSKKASKKSEKTEQLETV